MIALVTVVGCGGPAEPPPAVPAPAAAAQHSALADEDSLRRPYTKPALQDALTAERATEASLAHRVAEMAARTEAGASAHALAMDDEWRAAVADLAVRRRFIATLEACAASGRWCPPRLDDPPWQYDISAGRPGDPPLTAPLRYDLASWRAIADELYGRACACRTLGCVDSLSIAIDELEPRPMPRVASDERAATAITRARECLFRLRGRTRLRTTAPAQ